MDSKNKKLSIKKRSLAKATVTRISNYVNNFEPTADINLIRSRLDQLLNAWEAYNEVQTDLEIHDENEDHTADREAFEEAYHAVKAKMNTLLEPAAIPCAVAHSGSVAGSIRVSADVSSESMHVKLPTIKLPSFSGDYRQWMHFKDIFVSLVIDNRMLSNVQKLHYLLSSLSGEAHELVKSLPVCEANFKIAWEMLVERYQNDRLIASRHVKELLNLPMVSQESASDLRMLVNQLKSNINAIEALHLERPLHEILLSQLMLDRLDASSRKQWESRCATTQLPSLESLCSFLEQRCHALEVINSGSNKPNTSVQSVQKERRPKPGRASYVSTNTQSCSYCNGTNHRIYKCSQFLQLDIQQRTNFVKGHSLCYNCLRGGHHTNSCKSGNCRTCNKHHHTLLHFEGQRGTGNSQKPNSTPSQQFTLGNAGTNHTTTTQGEVSNNYCSMKVRPNTQVLLSTVLVKVRDNFGQLHVCRALLDSASQSHFVSEALVQRLKLKKHHNRFPIHGINNSTSETKHCVTLELQSAVSDYSTAISCSVLPRITGNMPATSISTHTWGLPSDITLADPTFYQPGKVDLLIGAETFFELLLPQQMSRPGNYPVLQNTKLGWILSGRIQQSEEIDSTAHPQKSFFLRSDDNLQQALQRFWEIEEVNHPIRNNEEKQCETHFVKNTIRDPTGRFITCLPLKQDPAKLGESYHTANTRLQQIERRLDRDPQLRAAYNTFLSEYESLGHMQLVDRPSDNAVPRYYLPHHPVFKESSTSTKVRVVFDASAKTRSGVSLNDILLVGPTIQQDLISIVLRFRLHQFVFTADITKMYRQIKIDARDYPLQRILWGRNEDGTPREFELTTVTYGTASAPFLATRCLHKLADDEQHRFPKAAAVVRRDMYVDDVLTGQDTIEDALELQTQMINLLSSGGFPLRKWCANHPALLAAIPADWRESQLPLQIDNDDQVKTLGLLWHPGADQLQIVNGVKQQHSNTSRLSRNKRQVLAIIASIFDPLGLVSPVVILCKVFLQQVWQENLDWDDDLPVTLIQRWLQIENSLPMLNSIYIDRLVLAQGVPTDVQLHGFCDSSEQAYGACIYLRSTNQHGEVTTNLLCSKSKVAPLKKLSIPRLELCGALLLARLVKKVLGALHISIVNKYLWTDSTVALAWITASPSRWKTFVANRVAEIQECTAVLEWRHVKSQDNPADIISRGANPKDLRDFPLWWNGPMWLKQPSECWPTTRVSEDSNHHDGFLAQTEANTHQKGNITLLASKQATLEMIEKFSTLTTCQRVVAYCLRFANNCTKPVQSRLHSTLSCEELHKALLACIRIAQHTFYAAEINSLSESASMSPKSELRNLNPFLDHQQILRVSTRLQHANVSYDNKFPIILPLRHHLTLLIVAAEHRRLLHANQQLLISSLRQHYWIPNIRRIVKTVIHKCIICFKLKAETAQQQMGILPAHRVQPARPFLNAGVDYAGPIHLKCGTPRSKTTTKAYIAVFVCFSTKAIHLELVSSLSTDAFLAAFRRFVSRRGISANVYSDNGTTFLGADRALKEFQLLVSNPNHQSQIKNHAAAKGCTWHFIPPGSPHFGGLWEAAVKSLKYHLRRTVGNSVFTFEEMCTVLCQVEACLNSRPLTPLTSDPSSIAFLSPGHFLIGEPLTSLPDPDLSDLKVNRLDRWQLIQRATQQLWKRWSMEYLHGLQQRTKWTTPHHNLQPGTVVLLKEESPPLQWKTAVITEVHPGPDGLVRVATIKTAAGSYRRPIHKLCPFPE